MQLILFFILQVLAHQHDMPATVLRDMPAAVCFIVTVAAVVLTAIAFLRCTSHTTAIVLIRLQRLHARQCCPIPTKPLRSKGGHDHSPARRQ